MMLYDVLLLLLLLLLLLQTPQGRHILGISGRSGRRALVSIELETEDPLVKGKLPTQITRHGLRNVMSIIGSLILSLKF